MNERTNNFRSPYNQGPSKTLEITARQAGDLNKPVHGRARTYVELILLTEGFNNVYERANELAQMNTGEGKII